MELVDTLDLGSSGATREGSSPFARTKVAMHNRRYAQAAHSLPAHENTGGTLNITVTAERPENDKVVVTITVPAAEVDNYVNQAYKNIARR